MKLTAKEIVVEHVLGEMPACEEWEDLFSSLSEFVSQEALVSWFVDHELFGDEEYAKETLGQKKAAIVLKARAKAKKGE